MKVRTVKRNPEYSFFRDYHYARDNNGCTAPRSKRICKRLTARNNRRDAARIIAQEME